MNSKVIRKSDNYIILSIFYIRTQIDTHNGLLENFQQFYYLNKISKTNCLQGVIPIC